MLSSEDTKSTGAIGGCQERHKRHAGVQRTVYLPFELHLDGIRSRLTPNTVVRQLTPMKNPVTGEDEYATLLKPTGFTSKRQELCATETFRLTTAGLSYDHSGKYGEFSPFEYTSA